MVLRTKRSALAVERRERRLSFFRMCVFLTTPVVRTTDSTREGDTDSTTNDSKETTDPSVVRLKRNLDGSEPELLKES